MQARSLSNGNPNPDRSDLRHYGAGETMCKFMLAAVANAIFDATGVRNAAHSVHGPTSAGGVEGAAPLTSRGRGFSV